MKESTAIIDIGSSTIVTLIGEHGVNDTFKILGKGEITKKLTVQANAFSATAKEKIEAVGGKAEEVM